jgi:1,4-alpha-glucan branching enzyme
MVNTMRGVVTQVNDSDRDIFAVKGALEKKMASDVFARVIYTENHDQVGHPPGQSRLPAMIDVTNHESIFAKKRSTLAAAIMLTSPGIPMIFQGQEMLETRAFGFNTPTNMDLIPTIRNSRDRSNVRIYRLRRNVAGKIGD